MDLDPQPRTARPPGATRRRAALAGALYLVTFATSVPTLVLYAPLRERADLVLGVGSARGVQAGLLLEVALAVACVGTAVVLFPVLRPRSTSAALGFLAARVVEAALILVGVLSLLSVLALRDRVAGTADADPRSLVTAQHALVALYDGTFLLGQSLMPVLCALCLGSVLYRSALVPRLIPAVGLLGAPLLLASDVAILLGAYARDSAAAGLAALPIAAWELALAVWLLAKGFRDPVAAPLPGEDRPAPQPRRGPGPAAGPSDVPAAPALVPVDG